MRKFILMLLLCSLHQSICWGCHQR